MSHIRELKYNHIGLDKKSRMSRETQVRFRERLVKNVLAYSIQKWSHGDHDTSKVAAAWFGACIFLVVVAAILKGFFNVGS